MSCVLDASPASAVVGQAGRRRVTPDAMTTPNANDKASNGALVTLFTLQLQLP
ncbi:hypothetical protein F1559_005029, partial [Cyanidiococcus yangmingshanensis]